ncbi:MAG: D-alanyl-D-alanine carboxypeptidase [Candidatus Saccharicenans subterraneus]|uniref:D-alanyl-D-alanine carboxypeptidase n=1 Tax=Candidatus Saccharicenans subterraneus TaxID=2508984 RepID=A0A3E2BK35_9BACT|nr:MAG: D-alanyl-D-alanine carboxypeptidase [Candidatus Saccharicenans subterraneum]
MSIGNSIAPGASYQKCDEIARLLEKYLKRLVARRNVKQSILAVETLDGSLRWLGAEGMARSDGTPMKPDLPFWIASVTKLFIAAAIFKLQELGQISIGDSIAAYLPENLIRGLHRVGPVDYSEKITVRHLLEHSSGLPDYLEVSSKDGRSLFQELLKEGDRWVSLEDIIDIIKEANSPLFPPQPVESRKKKVRYSDTNYQLLIAIIERVSRQPLQQVFEDMIFKPLGLKQTFLPGTEKARNFPDVASVWYLDKELHIPEAMASLKDLYSTAGDLLVFMRALVQGKLFSGPTNFDLRIQNWNRFGFSLSPVGPGWPIEYGLGLMRFRLPRFMTPFRPVPAIIGHTGVCGSWLFYCPGLELLLAGTVGQLAAGPVPFRFLPRLLNALRPYL